MKKTMMWRGMLFTAEGTGGGCEAWIHVAADGRCHVITDEEAALPQLGAPAVYGVYATEDAFGSEDGLSYEYFSHWLTNDTLRMCDTCHTMQPNVNDYTADGEPCQLCAPCSADVVKAGITLTDWSPCMACGSAFDVRTYDAVHTTPHQTLTERVRYCARCMDLTVSSGISGHTCTLTERVA